MTSPTNDRVTIRGTEILSKNWGTLSKVTFDYRRADGETQTLSREVYDRGHGAAILLYDPSRDTVLLTRQFRLPAFIAGHPEPLIEICAGLLDARDPEECIRAEAEEETGVRVRRPRRVFEAFMSPGSVTETLTFFVADYDFGDRVSDGGGKADEGEDIEILEPTLDEALAMVARGEIIDGKTIMMLSWFKLEQLGAAPKAGA